MPAFMSARAMKAAAILFAAGLVQGAVSTRAAPLPPFEPVDLCGAIRSIQWLAPMTLPGDERISGSASRDRTWPGRFAVILGQVTGIDASTRQRINDLLSTGADGKQIPIDPGEVLVVLPHEDPERLRGAAALCVTGFVISGDEGGTWTRYTGLWITAWQTDKM